MRKHRFLFVLFGLVVSCLVVGVVSASVVSRTGVSLGYSDGSMVYFDAGTYTSAYRVNNVWYVDGVDVGKDWYSAMVFSTNMDVAVQVVVVCIVLFAPAVGLFLVTKNVFAFFVGLLVGVKNPFVSDKICAEQINLGKPCLGDRCSRYVVVDMGRYGHKDVAGGCRETMYVKVFRQFGSL